MDNIDVTQQIDEALDSLPEEAKDFLYKGPYDQAITKLVQNFSLSEDQKKTLDYHLTQVILLMEHHVDLLALCQSWGFIPDQQAAFMNEVENAVIIPIVAATNYVEDDEDERTILTETINAPSPADVLASLKSRLTTPTAIAPVARELPPGPTKPAAPSQIPTSPSIQKKPGIDPYRELPN